MKKTPKKKKKKVARSNKENPALDPKYTPKVRREFLDMDYIDKLNPKEKEWLNKFTEEYLNASFKNKPSDLHKSKKSKRTIYNQNNARNRDMFSIAKANNLLNYSEPKIDDYEENNEVVSENIEDLLIDYIDSKKK